MWLEPDKDSKNDGINPLFGYYDNPYPVFNISMNSYITSNGFADLDRKLYFRTVNLSNNIVAEGYTVAILSQNYNSLVATISIANGDSNVELLSDTGINGIRIATLNIEDQYRIEAYVKDKAGHRILRFINVHYDNTSPIVSSHDFLNKLTIEEDKDSFGDGIDPLTRYFDSLFATINIRLNMDKWSLGYGNYSYNTYGDQSSENIHGSGFRDNPLYVRFEPITTGISKDIFINAKYPNSTVGQGAALTIDIKGIQIRLTTNVGHVILILADRAGNITTINREIDLSILSEYGGLGYDPCIITVDTLAPSGIELDLIDNSDSGLDGILPVKGFFDQTVIPTVDIKLNSPNDNGLSGLRKNKYVITTYNFGVEMIGKADINWNTYKYSNSEIQHDADISEAGAPGHKVPYFNDMILPTGQITIWTGLVDRAGNVYVVSQSLIVDITPPSINNFVLDFAFNTTNFRGDIDSGDDGIHPYYGYFDDNGVDIDVLSINYKEEYPRVNHLFVRSTGESVGADYDYSVKNVYATHNYGNVLMVVENELGQTHNIFMNVNTLEGRQREIIVYVSDLAGNVATKGIIVTVDLNAPVGDAEIIFIMDKDSGNDGIDPLFGYYDSAEISVVISNNYTDNFDDFRVNKYLVKSNLPYSSMYSRHKYLDALSEYTLISDNKYEVIVNQQFGQPSNNIYNFVPTTNTVGNIVVFGAVSDKAGNLVIVTKQLSIDITPPTGIFELILSMDTDSMRDGLAPLYGYYDSPTVGIIISASITDETGMRMNRYFVKTEKVESLPSYNVFNYKEFNYFKDGTTDPMAPGGVEIGSYYPKIYGIKFDSNRDAVYKIYAAVADLAGNIITREVTVTIDMTKPSGNIKVNLISDTSEYDDGAEPDPGWYDDNSIDYAIVNVGVEVATDNLSGIRGTAYLSKVITEGMVYDSTIWDAQESPSFNKYLNQNINISSPSIIYIGIADRAGNVILNSEYVWVDTEKPSGDMLFQIKDDIINNLNQLQPESGWYNDDTMEMNWTNPKDNLGLKDKPYRVRVNGLPWSEFYSQTYLNNYKVNSLVTTINITILASDRAGNIITDGMSVLLDMDAPKDFNISITADITDQNGDGILPQSGWYDDKTIDLSWSIPIDNRSGLRSKPYQLKSEVNAYGIAISQNYAKDYEVKEKYTTLYDREQSLLWVRAIDRAGNIREVKSSINVDMMVPENYELVVKNDTEENGIELPEAGWYNDKTLEVDWGHITDFGGLRSFGAFYIKEKGKNSWTTLNAREVETGTNSILVSEGITAKTLMMRVVDKAGNVRETESNAYKVDITIPTFSKFILIGDKDTEGKNLAAGWYNDQSVEWEWLGSDLGGLANQPYRYHNIDTPNAGWTNWKSDTQVEILTTWGIPEGFEVEVRDRAGNTNIRKGFVNVAQFTVTNSTQYFISINIAEKGKAFTGGVIPEANWFSTHTLNIKITTNYLSLIETNQLLAGMQYYMYNTNGQPDNRLQGVPSFNNVICQETGRAGMHIIYGIKLINGLKIEGRDLIYVDTKKPTDFDVKFKADDDSGNDGIAPELGWDDDREIGFDIKVPNDEGVLREKAYRYRFVSPNMGWSQYQSDTKVSVLTVNQDGIYQLEIMAVDKAGNVATVGMRVSIDTLVPTMNGMRVILSADVDSKVDGCDPIYGWYDNDVVVGEVSWNGVMTENYLRSSYLYMKSNRSKEYYQFKSPTFSVQVIPGNLIPINLEALIVDKAGNVAKMVERVYADEMAPGISSVIIRQDASEGQWFEPEYGYYDDETIDLEWQEPEGGGLRDNPYRVKSSMRSSQDWSIEQSYRYYDNYQTSEGVQLIIVEARDKAGNVATFSASVTVDMTQPLFVTIDMEADDDSGEGFYAPLVGYDDDGEFVISFTVGIDNLGLKAFPYVVLVGQLGDYEVGSSMEYTNLRKVSVNIGEEGGHTISVLVVDRAGNYSTNEIRVTVDKKPSTLEVKVNRFEFVVTSQLRVTMSINEGVIRLPEMKLKIGLKEYDLGISRNNEREYIGTLNVGEVVSDGIGELIYKVVDNGGWVTSRSVNTVPKIIVRLYSPQDPDIRIYNTKNGGTEWTNSRNIIISSSVANLYPEYKWFVSENLTQPVFEDSAWVSFSKIVLYKIEGLGEGEKRIYAWVRNDRGMSMRAVSRSIKLDTIKPESTVYYYQTTMNFGEQIFKVQTNEELMKVPTVSLEFENTKNIQYMRVVGSKKLYNAEFLFNEDLGEGYVSVHVEIVDRAGNVSTINTGVSRITLKMQYPETPVMRIEDKDNENQTAYTNQKPEVRLRIGAKEVDTKWYMIVEDSSEKPKSTDSRWLSIVPTISPTGYDKEGLIVYNYSAYNESIGYLKKTFYGWVKNTAGYICVNPAIQRITMDYKNPDIVVAHDALRDPTIAVRITVDVSERTIVNESAIEYQNGTTESVSIGKIATTNKWIGSVIIDEIERDWKPYYVVRMSDYAGNKTEVRVDLQPILEILTMNVLTRQVQARSDDVALLMMIISPSSRVELRSISIEKIGDTLHKSVKQLKLQTEEGVVLGDTSLSNGEGDLTFFFKNGLIINQVVTLTILGDIELTAMEPFKFKVDTNAFVVSSYNRVNTQLLPYESDMINILDGQNELRVYHKTNELSGKRVFVNQYDQNVILFDFDMEAYPYSIQMNNITFKVSGNMSESYIKDYRLYIDKNADGIFDINKDVLAVQTFGQIINGKISFKDMGMNIGSVTTKYFLVGNVALDAPVGSRIQFIIEKSAGIDVQTGGIVNTSALPLYSRISAMQQYKSRVTVMNVNLVEGDVFQGATISGYNRLHLLADHYSARIESLVYVISSNMTDDNIENIKLFGSNIGTMIISDNSYEISTRIIRDDNKIKVIFNEEFLVSQDTPYLYTELKLRADGATGNIQLIISPKLISIDAFVQTTQDMILGKLNIVIARKPIITDVSIPKYVKDPYKITINYDSWINGELAASTYISGMKVALSDDGVNNKIMDWTKYAIVNRQESLILDEEIVIKEINMQHNKEYYLKLKAESYDPINSKYYESSEKIVTFRVDLTAPTVLDGSKVFVNQSIINSGANSNAQNIFLLSWSKFRDDESGVEKYELERQVGTIQKWEEVSYTITKNSYKIMDVDRSKQYRYRVRAMNTAKNYSKWIESDYTEATKPIEVIYNYSFYPNPVLIEEKDGTIIYQLNQDSSVTIKIYDALGHFVKEMNFSAGKEGGSSLAPNKVLWDGTNEANERVAKGGYIVVITADADGPQNTVKFVVGVIR
ncbi:MAG: hypothetical protein A2Y40_00730 [Candidatus Margulisbacteria bacterium GWF2_35_9]|nr:MAG: hypothetical protein A2Y40_00730 [Candidatus Margulisbacteria bacterium GWF2_35_9]